VEDEEERGKENCASCGIERKRFFQDGGGLAFRWADRLGTRKILVESQRWEGFEEARKTWVAALASKWIKWKVRKLDVTAGDDAARRLNYFLLQEVFLMRLRSGKEDDAELFREHARLFCEAAVLGDTEFFQRFAKVLTGKRDGRDLQGQILSCWMSAGLWSASQKAAADFVLRKFFQGGKGRASELEKLVRMVKDARLDLKLYHHPRAMILEYDTHFKPILRE